MQELQLQKANQQLLLKLSAVAVLMFGFGFALVPLYNLFCDITGLNGKTGQVSVTEARNTTIDMSRSITVRFVTTSQSELPWEFKPLADKITVHPGELGKVNFSIKNMADHAITAQAIPSLAPTKVSKYFNKTECFCFSQQTLQAGEEIIAPVHFIIDPAAPKDISQVILSYTFFKSTKG